MNEEKIKEKIRIAREIADSEEEPYKKEIFMVLLDNLLKGTILREDESPNKFNNQISDESKKTLNGKILELFSSDWGKIPKGLREIKEELVTRGHHYPITTISARLIGLTQRGKLRRIKNESKGIYEYILSK